MTDQHRMEKQPKGPARSETIRRMVLEERRSYSKIGKQLGISPTTVCRDFRPFRTEINKHNRRVTAEEERKIVDALEHLEDRPPNERSLTSIGRQHQRSTHTILRIRNRHFGDGQADEPDAIRFRHTHRTTRCDICKAKINVQPCPLCLARGLIAKEQNAKSPSKRTPEATAAASPLSRQARLRSPLAS